MKDETDMAQEICDHISNLFKKEHFKAAEGIFIKTVALGRRILIDGEYSYRLLKRKRGWDYGKTMGLNGWGRHDGAVGN